MVAVHAKCLKTPPASSHFRWFAPLRYAVFKFINLAVWRPQCRCFFFVC